jgi:dTDP-4-amino-4,6-dideoxygalactose transaminase
MAQEILSKRYTVPDLPSAEEILPFLREIDANRWYSNFGPLVTRFEQAFAQTMAKAHGEAKPFQAVTTCSGYNAITIGLRLLGLGPDKTVLVPAITFPACPLAVENIGAKTILCDVDPQEWTITPSIARKVAEHTKIDAVMPVCLYGKPLDAQAWDAFTQETGIPVLMDAASAIESQRYLTRGLVVHSLHATKPFGIGEGGLLVTADPELALKARQISNFGTVERITRCGGENGKMSEYHAAVGLAQLDRWAGIKKRRQAVLDLYNREFVLFPESVVLQPDINEAVVSSLMLTLKQHDGRDILKTMQNQGIACHRTYLPALYRHPHLSGLPLATLEGELLYGSKNPEGLQKMRGSRFMEKTLLGLPFHALMKPEEVHKTIMILSEALGTLTGETDEDFDDRLVSNG